MGICRTYKYQHEPIMLPPAYYGSVIIVDYIFIIKSHLLVNMKQKTGRVDDAKLVSLL